jgi:hypothetical protein
MSFLPAFLRRRFLLARSRAALVRGEVEEALALLADPLFQSDADAQAVIRAARASIAEATRADAPVLEAHVGARASSPLTAFLAEMRVRRAVSEHADPASANGTRAQAPAPSSGARCSRFRLAIDDAGEFLVVVGGEFVLGHLSSKIADLPFLSEVEREHARLRLAVGFQGGASWRIEPIGASIVRIGANPVPAHGRALADGDEVTLGARLAFHFRSTDPSSAAAMLDLRHGAECHGASRILLVPLGLEGRVGIGARGTRHVSVPSLEHEIALFVAEVQDAATGELGRRISIRSSARGQGESAPTIASSFDLACPPLAPCRFTLGATAKDRSPFSIVVSPIDDSSGGT